MTARKSGKSPLPSQNPKSPEPFQHSQVEISAEIVEAISSLTIQQVQTYSGPIPVAAEYEKYEGVLAGSAHRILTMAEEDQKAKIRDRARLRFESILGLILGNFTLLAFAGAGTYVVLNATNDKQIYFGMALIAPQVLASVQKICTQNR